jgi:adenylylsulfate kinase
MPIPRSPNLGWTDSHIAYPQRTERNGHQGAVVWLTGLSGAGKSTMAQLVERELFERGCQTYILDGDNLRHGLNRDLAFTPEDRTENIRRVGEVANLLRDAGLIVLTAFISPYLADRRIARATCPDGAFVEVYCRCDLAECERRDPKGLYRKARAGEIAHFTGISAPYEPPVDPEVVLRTDRDSPDRCAARVVAELERRGVVPPY